jgi:hypothetical protein
MVASAARFAVPHVGSDPDAAVFAGVDAVEREATHVDQEIRARQPELQVIDEVRPAREENCPGSLSDAGHRARDIGGPLVRKWSHDAAARIAAAILT